MSETSPYMTAIPGPSADYRFVPANGDVVEEAEIYENIEFRKQTPNNPQQAEPPPASSQQPKKSKENGLNFKRILVVAVIALFTSLALAACALGMAIQAGNKLAQVQVEVGALLAKLDNETDERRNADVTLESSVAAQVTQTNSQVDANHGILMKFTESMNSSFVIFQQNLDVLSQKNDGLNLTMDSSFSEIRKEVDLFVKIYVFLFHHQTNLTEVLNLALKEDVLSQVTDALIQHHNDLTGVTPTFSEFQRRMDLFSNVFKYLIHHRASLTEVLEAMRTGDLLLQISNIRLVGGTSNSGRVEVYYNGEWGTICDDIMDPNAGNVMCRHLGFTTATDMRCCAAYGQGSGQIWLDDLRCIGNETTLGDCTHRGWGVENCAHSEDLSITCS